MTGPELELCPASEEYFSVWSFDFLLDESSCSSPLLSSTVFSGSAASASPKQTTMQMREINDHEVTQLDFHQELRH